ncbi:MAG: LptF/LptG family permease [Limnochordales bacterium]
MRVLDRYILRELLGPLLYGVLSFTGLFIGVDLVQLVRMTAEYGAPLWLTLELIALRLPQVFVYTFPMAVLLATLLTLSRLSATSEIVAMQAGTVSFYRIVAPVLVVGLLVAGLSLAVEEWVVPAANYEYRRVLTEDVQGGQLPTVTRNVILKEYQGGILRGFLYASRYDSAARTMYDVTIVEMERGRPVRTTYAARVVWQGNTWLMHDGVIYTHDGEPGLAVDFRRGTQPVSIGYRPEQVVQAQKNPEEMTIRELRDHIAALEARGDDTREHVLHLHLKFAVPAASFVFALLAAPLGVQSHRSATSVGFGLSILVIFAYYILMTLGTALGESGQLPPAAAAWLQNAILGMAGLVLLWRAGRR